MVHSLFLTLLLAGSPARAKDWLAEAERAAASAAIPDEIPPEKTASEWTSYQPPSRLFLADIPAEGWRAFEEDDALGTVVRVVGPEDSSGSLRTLLSVRFIDRDYPNFQPAKDAVDAMRRDEPGREVSSPLPLRVEAGLARVFEITETRRLPTEEGPSAPIAVHQYVAVIPRGDAYYLVRLVTARADYLDYRDVFVRFLKSLRPFGAR